MTDLQDCRCTFSATKALLSQCVCVCVSILPISSLCWKTTAWGFLGFVWESQFHQKRLNKSASDNTKPLIQLFCSSGLASFIFWLKLKQLQASKLITVLNIIGFMKFGSYHLKKGKEKKEEKFITIHYGNLQKVPQNRNNRVLVKPFRSS